LQFHLSLLGRAHSERLLWKVRPWKAVLVSTRQETVPPPRTSGGGDQGRSHDSATPNATQPATNAKPPSGVITPTGRGAPSASAYRLPQNRTIPSANRIAPRCAACERPAESAHSANASACQNWKCTAVCHTSSIGGATIRRNTCAPSAPSNTALAPAKAAAAAGQRNRLGIFVAAGFTAIRFPLVACASATPRTSTPPTPPGSASAGCR